MSNPNQSEERYWSRLVSTVGCIAKVCAKCGIEKPATEFTKRNDGRGGGLQSQCKECHRERATKYREQHPDKHKAAYTKWRRENPSAVKQSYADWAKNNRHLRRANDHNRMERAAGGKLSGGLAKKLLRLQRGKCACCRVHLGDDYHMDHVMPLALGGENIDDNIQLLCPTCNRSKHAKHPVDFMQQRGFLI